MKKALLFLTVLLLGNHSYSQSLLDATEKYFNPETANVIGSEVELAGLSVKQVTDTSLHTLGGSVVGHTRLESHVNSRTGALEHFRVKDKELVDSRIGKMAIKPEDNSADASDVMENFAKTQIVEIVSAPIKWPMVVVFQELVTALKKIGAQGTSKGHAISIQVNVEMGQGQREKIRVSYVLDLIRNYLKPENRALLAAEFKVPSYRQKYLGYYSPGMMERIFNRDYSPDWETFYFDFMYRQSLEVLGHKQAWTMEEKWARALLRAELHEKGFEAILPVVKWNYLRISSLMMFMVPNDWLTQYLIDTTWFHAYPIVEFREPNNDFEMERTTRRILGFVQATEKLGEFEYAIDENGEGIVRSVFERFSCSLHLKPAS